MQRVKLFHIDTKLHSESPKPQCGSKIIAGKKIAECNNKRRP